MGHDFNSLGSWDLNFEYVHDKGPNFQNPQGGPYLLLYTLNNDLVTTIEGSGSGDKIDDPNDFNTIVMDGLKACTIYTFTTSQFDEENDNKIAKLTASTKCPKSEKTTETPIIKITEKLDDSAQPMNPISNVTLSQNPITGLSTRDLCTLQRYSPRVSLSLRAGHTQLKIF